MSEPVRHSVTLRRLRRDWSQGELAARAGIPRTTVSAIEGRRLTPSVTAALALAGALECSVEELFGEFSKLPESPGPEWAWFPGPDPCRYWEAEVNGRRLHYPVESLSLNALPHDGTWREGVDHGTRSDSAGRTLVMAGCDPAAGLLAGEYARATGFRLLVVQRGSSQGLDLLKRGLVHLAGVHRSTPEEPARNSETVREQLGPGFQLARVAQWQEGLAVATGTKTRSPQGFARKVQCWALRERGSAARECLDQLVPEPSGRTVLSHHAVAEAVRGGWAEAGVCLQLCAEEAGLKFLPVRTEAFDLCFDKRLQNDARIQALLRQLRSQPYRKTISELPGYDARHAGELLAA